MSRSFARTCLLGSILLPLLPATNAFYLPGAAPHDYVEGDVVDLYVNALTPMLAGHDNAKLVCQLASSRNAFLPHSYRVGA